MYASSIISLFLKAKLSGIKSGDVPFVAGHVIVSLPQQGLEAGLKEEQGFLLPAVASLDLLSQNANQILDQLQVFGGNLRSGLRGWRMEDRGSIVIRTILDLRYSILNLRRIGPAQYKLG